MSGCTLESRRCEFWAQGGDYVRPPCCTQHLKDLLFFTHDLLERHGIPHWLDFGALLGAVRSGELIAWDADVDFGVWIEDAGRISALESEIARAGHLLDMSQPHAWRILLSPTNTQHADMFPWRDENAILKMRWPGFPDEAWSFPRRFVDHAQPIDFYGRRFLAPAPVHEFLVHYRYGDDYRIPRRFEDLQLRARLAPSLRRFVAQRTFEERRRRTLDLLCRTLDNTRLRGRYRKTAEAPFGQTSFEQDEADAAFAVAPGARQLFLDVLPHLQAAGFSLLSQPAANGAWRMFKDGACFDFHEQPDTA